MGDYKSAYIVLGHGGEGHGKIKVPPGCCVVVDVHTAEFGYQGVLSHTMNKIVGNSKFAKLLLSPESQYKEILPISSSGSLAIYKEGDMCPDFSFDLMSYWLGQKKSNGVPTSIRLASSGIVQYPFKFNFKDIQNYENIFNVPFKTLIDFYEGSIYPTQDQLHKLQAFYEKYFALPPDTSILHYLNYFKNKEEALDRIQEAWNKQLRFRKNATHKDFGDILDKYYELLEYFKINLSDIFKMVSDGRLEPGVLYNLVCRATSESVQEQAENTAFKLGENRHVKNLTQTTAANRIGEAEMHRKRYIPEKIKKIRNNRTAFVYNPTDPNINAYTQRVLNKERVLNAINKEKNRERKNKGLRWKKTENGKWVENPSFTQKLATRVGRFFTKRNKRNTNTNTNKRKTNINTQGKMHKKARMHNLFNVPSGASSFEI